MRKKICKSSETNKTFA